MYLYFLPLLSSPSNFGSRVSSSSVQPFTSQPLIPELHLPTPDGGIEHTAAKFRPPSEWLSLYASNEILLFAPQFFLLYIISPFLSAPLTPKSAVTTEEDLTILRNQRQSLTDFIQSGDPPWTEKYLSATSVLQNRKLEVFSLDEPAVELQGTSKRGDRERVLVINRERKSERRGSRGLEVAWRKDIFAEKDIAKL